MPRINEIITFINTELKTVLNSERFQGGVFYDENAELIPVFNKENIKTQTKPAIIDFDGDGRDVTIDDTLPFQIYHRIAAPFSFEAIPDKENFGDPGQTIQETANMVMIIISDTSKIRMQDYDFLALILANIPQEMTHSALAAINLLGVEIQFENTNTDKEQNYKNEYAVNEYGLKTNSIMYAVSYKIITTFSKQCFPACG